MEYKFIVTVDTDTPEHAQQVMQERIEYSEDYGFSYMIDWS